MTRPPVFWALALLGASNSPVHPQEAQSFPIFSQSEARQIASAVQQYAGSTVLQQLLSRIEDRADRRIAIAAVANAMEAVGDDGSALVWAIVSVEGPPELTKDAAAHILLALGLTMQVFVQVIADDIRGVGNNALVPEWDRDVALDVLCTTVSAMRKIGELGVNLVTVR